MQSYEKFPTVTALNGLEAQKLAEISRKFCNFASLYPAGNAKIPKETMEEQQDNDIDNENTEVIHIEKPECNCTDCRKKRQSVQIIDIDRYVNALNDWD